MNKFKILLLSLFTFLASCSGDDDGGQAQGSIELELVRLEQLENSLEYEAWIVVEGENISLGRFTDTSFPKVFKEDPQLIANANAFKLSIEPGNDPSPAISNTVLLSGTFAGNAAQLDIEETIGFFDNAKGVFVLKTPTDNNNSNEQSGIYWQKANGEAGLELPTLPEGWKYEGWVSVPTPGGGGKLIYRYISCSTGAG